MKPYKDFRPTQFDSHIPLEDREEWLVLNIAHNRDSDCLEESNFQSVLKMLSEADPTEETWEMHSFNHWACGYFEIFIVKPGSVAEEMGKEIEKKLANYCVLDEQDFSEREQDAALQTWQNCYNNQERIEYIRKHRGQFDCYSFVELLHNARGQDFRGYASELLG
jgi:hypothetical protein